jgi:hypothetical protein
VGADGVRSVVRAAFEGRGDFRGSMEQLPGKFKVLHQRMPAALASDAVHAMTPAASKDKEDGTFGLFIIPAVGDQACMLVNWSVRRRVYLKPAHSTFAAHSLPRSRALAALARCAAYDQSSPQRNS